MRTSFQDFYKSLTTVAKPGNTAHSAKWDRCVEHVRENGDGGNAYAICTAMIGNESFKSMSDDAFMEKVEEYIARLGIYKSKKKLGKDVGTSFAGESPNSLLARQDLERTDQMSKDSEHDITIEIFNGSELSSEKARALVKGIMDNPEPYAFVAMNGPYVAGDGFSYTDLMLQDTKGDMGIIHLYSVPFQSAKSMLTRMKKTRTPVDVAEHYNGNAIYNVESGQYMVAGPNGSERTFLSIADARQFIDDHKIFKGTVERTGEQLKEAQADAEDARTIQQKESVVDNIKAIQERRQKATIAARQGETKKSFKELWGDLTKKPSNGVK